MKNKKWFLLLVILFFLTNSSGFTKPLFWATWDEKIDADTGPIARPWDIVTLSKKEFKKGKGCLDLVRKDAKEKTGILFDGVEINPQQGSIESYFKTKWSAQSGSAATMVFNMLDISKEVSIWVSCDGKNFIIDFANPFGKEKRIYANIEKIWDANQWHHFVLTWKVIPGSNNDIIEVFVDEISVGKRDDMELWNGKNPGIVKLKLAIGLNTSHNFGGNFDGYVDEFTIHDEIIKIPSKKQVQERVELKAERKMQKAGLEDTNLINIAPLSKLKSEPYLGYSLSTIVDGLIPSIDDCDGTLVGDAPIFTPALGMNIPIQFEFLFDKSVEIQRIRFYQYLAGWEGFAKEYLIEVDLDGDGKYDKVLIKGKEGKSNEWMDHSFPPIKITSLRFTPTKGEKGTYGCRYYPVLGEFEIYTDKKSAEGFSKITFLPQKEKSIPKLEVIDKFIQSDVNPEKKWNEGFLKGVYLTFGMLGYTDEEINRRANYLKKLGVNHIVLYSHTRDSSGNLCAIWPSKFLPGSQDNALEKRCNILEENNIGLFSTFWPVPFGRDARVQELDKFPCMLSSEFCRKVSSGIYNEIAESGVGGIVLGGDEYFLTSHPLPVPSDDPCREEFKKYYGYDSPPEKFENTERYRKWVLFQYEQLARLFKLWHENMKKINQKAISTTLFYADNYNCSGRIEFGICDDIIGYISGIDTMGTDPYWSHNSPMGHYYAAEMTKRYRAATKNRGAIMVPQITAFLWIEGKEKYVQYSSPLMVYGPAVSALMHGAKGIEFYRGDYALNLYTGELMPGGIAVQNVFSLMDTLEAKNFHQFYIPKTIALLYSRASEDWWRIAYSSENKSSKPIEGWTYNRATMEVLFRKGYPFEMYYLDQMEGLKEIGNFKVIIFPFVYSIPKEAEKIIEGAIAKGTKVIVIKHKGETDEYGNLYPEPILGRLIQEGKIDYLDYDLNKSNYFEFAEKLSKILDEKLGKDKSFYFENCGYDVETALWENKKGDKLLWILNWEEKLAEIELGIKISSGEYKITQIDFSGEREVKLGGKTEVNAELLRKFGCSLLPGEVKVLYIEKSKVINM